MTQAVDAPMNQGEVSELLPCPFCGAKTTDPIERVLQLAMNEPHPDDPDYGLRGTTWTVQCDNCTATMGYFDSPDEAIAAWNRRHCGAKAGDAVGVKPLEWVAEFYNADGDLRRHPSWIAATNLGKDFRVFEAWWGKEDKWAFVFDGSFYHSEAEAKSAAQADYKARILSALSPSPDGGGAVAPLDVLGVRDFYYYYIDDIVQRTKCEELRGSIGLVVAQAIMRDRELRPAPARPALPDGELDQGALEAAEVVFKAAPAVGGDPLSTAIRAYLKAAAPLPQDLSRGERERAIAQAARDLIASRSDTYRAGNNRRVGMQDENGEKMWLVPFDEMFALERALSEAGKPDTKGERE